MLSCAYGLARGQVVERIRHVLCLPRVFTEDAEQVLLALDWHERGMDLGDALHLAIARGATEAFATFDMGIPKAVRRLDIQFPILTV